MFGKLAQIRNRIAHAITSLESQKPLPPNDPHLQEKLKFFLDHIMSADVSGQFKAYHELQAPQICLNQSLSEIYHSPEATTVSITCILHFYTFLLVNCNNQLVICKIVSDSFVLTLTEVYLDRLHLKGDNGNAEVEEINSYKIALVKAYVSRIDDETLKYMILGDRMRILQNCIACSIDYLKEERQWGIEATCMSNSVLIILGFLMHRSQYYSVCFQQANGGIASLLVKLNHRIHSNIVRMIQNAGHSEDELQDLKSRIMYIVDMVASISDEKYRRQIVQNTFEELVDLRDLFRKLIQQFAISENKNGQYDKIVQIIKVLLRLLSIYFTSTELTDLFEKSLLPILDQFIETLKRGVTSLANRTYLQQKGLQYQRQVNRLLHLFCCHTEILAFILQSGGYFLRRGSANEKEKQLKILIVNRVNDIIQLLLSEEATEIMNLVCSKSIKLLLLSLMQLTVENYQTLHEYSALRLHQRCIERLQRLLKRSQQWDYVILHYQGLLKLVSQSLLSVESQQSSEYLFCQYHDPHRAKQPTGIQIVTNAIIANECARNFRFMIVQNSYIQINNIKLEKNYHTNFISPGWFLEPGQTISYENQQFCQLLHVSNGLKIPITVITDEECLIFAIRPQLGGQQAKVLLNIRYKMVEGFTVEKQMMKVKLKGGQEVVLEAAREQMGKFKDYLIQKRDKSRQKELKFIHYYLDLYYSDNFRIIQQIGETQIAEELPVNQEQPEPENSENVEHILPVVQVNDEQFQVEESSSDIIGLL